MRARNLSHWEGGNEEQWRWWWGTKVDRSIHLPSFQLVYLSLCTVVHNPTPPSMSFSGLTPWRHEKALAVRLWSLQGNGERIGVCLFGVISPSETPWLPGNNFPSRHSHPPCEQVSKCLHTLETVHLRFGGSTFSAQIFKNKFLYRIICITRAYLHEQWVWVSDETPPFSVRLNFSV